MQSYPVTAVKYRGDNRGSKAIQRVAAQHAEQTLICCRCTGPQLCVSLCSNRKNRGHSADDRLGCVLWAGHVALPKEPLAGPSRTCKVQATPYMMHLHPGKPPLSALPRYQTGVTGLRWSWRSLWSRGMPRRRSSCRESAGEAERMRWAQRSQLSHPRRPPPDALPAARQQPSQHAIISLHIVEMSPVPPPRHKVDAAALEVDCMRVSMPNQRVVDTCSEVV